MILKESYVFHFFIFSHPMQSYNFNRPPVSDQKWNSWKLAIDFLHQFYLYQVLFRCKVETMQKNIYHDLSQWLLWYNHSVLHIFIFQFWSPMKHKCCLRETAVISCHLAFSLLFQQTSICLPLIYYASSSINPFLDFNYN